MQELCPIEKEQGEVQLQSAGLRVETITSHHQRTNRMWLTMHVTDVASLMLKNKINDLGLSLLYALYVCPVCLLLQQFFSPVPRIHHPWPSWNCGSIRAWRRSSCLASLPPPPRPSFRLKRELGAIIIITRWIFVWQAATYRYHMSPLKPL